MRRVVRVQRRLSGFLTESVNDANLLHERVKNELKPRGIIEQNYVAEIAWRSWEIDSLQRSKRAIVNLAFRPALQEVLMQLLREPGQLPHAAEEEAELLALAWFTDQEAKKKVVQILERFNLDEFAIEAEATRRVSSDLEILDRMLASSELRRTKALRCLTEYRTNLAPQLRESANWTIEGKVVRRLEHAPGQKPAA
jgi:hypothetical protein